jgi:CDP-diacylglycerol--glycerol-3-phosphate 3-phosphatidyltransferase
MIHRTINVPTVLTLIRLIVAPFVLPVLLVYLLPFNSLFINGALALLFIVFALTDFFDGHLARRLQQETRLGKLLDPLADKCLVYSTLIALLAVGKIYFYWVIIFVGREFFVMGLRLIALEHGSAVTVSWWGKIKTVLQMALLTVLIANPYQVLGLCNAWCWNGVELVLLISALGVSVFSAYQYYQNCMVEFRKGEERQ